LTKPAIPIPTVPAPSRGCALQWVGISDSDMLMAPFTFVKNVARRPAAIGMR
jgi:hypothetical protein